MKRFLLAPALAALAMFIWGFLVWAVPHRLPYQTLSAVPDDAAAGDALNRIFPETGIYVIPSPFNDPERAGALFEKGPTATVSIVKEGRPAMDPVLMLKGYLHEFVVCLLLMMVLTRLSIPCRSGVVRFCIAVGLIGTVFCRFGTVIWWYQPIGWHLANALYDLGAFAAAGLVLAPFAIPGTKPVSAAAAA